MAISVIPSAGLANTQTLTTLQLTNALGTAYGGTALSSFTANGVLYASSTSALATGSGLTFDGTNLGVGGAVNTIGSGITAIQATGSGTNSGGFRMRNSDGTKDAVFYIDSVGFHLTSVTSTPLVFDYGNSEQMRLNSTGLGIGTSSATAKLDVYNGQSTQLRVRGTSTRTSSSVLNAFEDDTNGGKGSWGSNAYAGTQYSNALTRYQSDISGWGIIGNNYVSTYTVNDALLFSYVSNTGTTTEYARIDYQGNFGLAVTPAGWYSSDGYTHAIQVSTTASLVGNNGTTRVMQNAYFNSSGTPTYLTTNYASQYLQNAGGHIFYTAASNTAGNPIAFTQAMTLNNNGYLGIGTSSPGVNLEIGANDNTVKALSIRYSTVPAYYSGAFDGSYGLATISNNQYNTSSGSSSWSSTSNANYAVGAIQVAASTTTSQIRFLTANASNTSPSEVVRIDGSGNLLVGATSGSSKLVVGSAAAAGVTTPTAIQMDNSYTSSSAYNALKFYLYKTSSETYGLGLGPNGDVQYWAGNTTNGQHAWYTSQTLKMIMNPSGQLILGNSALAGYGGIPPKMEIYNNNSYSGDADGGSLVIYGTSNATGQGGALTLGSSYGGGGYGTFARVRGSKNNSTTNDTGGGLAFDTRPSGGNFAQAAIIDSSGNFTFSRASTGIYFNNSSSISTQLFNDYEYGTWTPAIANSSGGSSTDAGSYGWYVKVGKIVHVGGTVSWSAIAGSFSGYTIVTGLPFNNISPGSARAWGSFGVTPGSVVSPSSTYQQLALVIDPGHSYAYLIAQNATGSYTQTLTVASSGNIYGFGATFETTF